ncbi:MAG: beta-glucuronidase [Promethearchaeota archaeon]
MLYPRRNKYRQYIDLSGFWDFRFDPSDRGQVDGWHDGFNDGIPIAVPASWNDQFAGDRDFLGPAWYQIRFNMPWGWKDRRIILRFGSINYLADAWLNGKHLGSHEGGHLPFEFNISSKIKPEKNLLVVRVDGNLAQNRVPPGNGPTNFPATNFDFFPFCGIHRPVLLYAVPEDGIEDITVSASIEGVNGNVKIKLNTKAGSAAIARFTMKGNGTEVSINLSIDDKTLETVLSVPNAAFWAPEKPNLYELTVELLRNEITFDSYTLQVGIRTISVEGNQLLLNGKPIFLKGFGRHEDFPVIGRGYFPSVIVKDFSLMKWIGANSFRTSHYPYSEQMMDMADKLGILVIDETPAVGLTFKRDSLERHLTLCRQYIEELIARDKNHPSVIMWSLANEPSRSREAKSFFRQLYDRAKELDPTRLVTVVSMLRTGDKAFEFCDIVCMNRYFGWYTEQGRIEDGCKVLSDDLDRIYKKYPKPMILSEFGADTIPGWHAQPAEMFSEEYQVKFLKQYIDVLNNKSYIVGSHVWNMCDFKTSQNITRMGAMNFKGVFTRDRRPKMAAHLLRKLWRGDID